MPLSDHEQRLLDEIERALYEEDPKFAASVRAARGRSRARRSIALCILGALVGLALVLVGLIFQVIALSVVGFVFVVGASGYAVQTVRGRDSGATPSASEAGQASPSPARQQGLRGRMEDRLRRRFEQE